MADKKNAFDAQLELWRKEQRSVASQVIVLPYLEKNDSLHDRRYNVLGGKDDGRNMLYGGVDVSFSEREGDLAVAVYVVMELLDRRRSNIVYRDHEMFRLSVPYVSSYLSFREIDPLERLIKKQILQRPEATPNVILVDGNGIFHKRAAGIACFVGVRTGIKAIGVGKSMYHHDGLETTMVKNAVENRVKRFASLSLDGPLFVSESTRRAVIDCNAISPTIYPDEKTNCDGEDSVDTMGALASKCCAFAVKLVGSSGRVWGAALVGHGGELSHVDERGEAKVKRRGTKRPIFISVGHMVSLEEAVQTCAHLSLTRIPEPIRAADLYGRKLMRDHADDSLC